MFFGLVEGRPNRVSFIDGDVDVRSVIDEPLHGVCTAERGSLIKRRIGRVACRPIRSAVREASIYRCSRHEKLFHCSSIAPSARLSECSLKSLSDGREGKDDAERDQSRDSPEQG